MTSKHSVAALAHWKHASRVLGWNENNSDYIRGLAQETWQNVQGSKESLLFLLDRHIPSDLLDSHCCSLIIKQPKWMNKKEHNLFMEALATSPNLTTQVAKTLVVYAPIFILKLLALNPALQGEALLDLISIGKASVLHEVSKNSHISLQAIDALLDSRDRTIADNLIKYSKTGKVPLAERYYAIERSGINPSKNSERYAAAAMCDATEADQRVGEWLLNDDRHSLLGYTAHGTLSEDTAYQIIETGHYELKANIATNPFTPAVILDELAHPWQLESLRYFVAAHSTTSISTAASLLVDESSIIRMKVLAENANLTESLVVEALFDEHSDFVLCAGFARYQLPPHTFSSALQRLSDPEAFRYLIKTANRIPADFFHYAIALDPSFLGYAVQHPSCPPEFRYQAETSSIETERVAALNSVVFSTT